MDEAALRRAPKVLLHDHLDGGLRPETIAALAAGAGIPLPAPEHDLAAWFHRGGSGGDLATYLEPFAHTVAVMQRAEALRRVARECVEDLADDGIVHAEVRFAPELCTDDGLSLDAVLDAVGDGLAEGPDEVGVRLLVCVMRHLDRGGEVVAAAVRARDRGVPVVGVDLAGPEAGHPAAAHASALAAAREAGLRLTLHAGEDAGPVSVADALDQGASRIGHGVRLADELAADGGPGPVARRAIAAGVALEVCPTSNVHTGVVGEFSAHPVDHLRAAGIAVTVNTDNRLMSGVRLSDEFARLGAVFGWDLDDVSSVTQVAVDAAFLDDADRAALDERVRRGFAALGGDRAATDGPGGVGR